MVSNLAIQSVREILPYVLEGSSPFLQRVYSFHYHISAYAGYSFRDYRASYAAGLAWDDVSATFAAQALLIESALPSLTACSTQLELQLKVSIQMCCDTLVDKHWSTPSRIPSVSLRSRFRFGIRTMPSVPPHDTGPVITTRCDLPALPRNFGNIDGDINFTSAAFTKSVSYCMKLPFSCFSGVTEHFKMHTRGSE